MKTNKGLVEYAKAQLGKPYWYGTYGKAASEELYKLKKRQYPDNYKWAYRGTEAGIKVHDCVGLIKGYLWSDNADDAFPQYNSAQDVSANGMNKKCVIRGNMDCMPEVEGVLVFFDGHVGIYEGNGFVIEARGRNYGVVRTRLKDRKWKNWGYCPFITYEVEEYKPTVREWQTAAAADGFSFSEYGIDGIWGRECEKIAKKAIVKKRLLYKYPNLTKMVQRYLGCSVDGKCGSKTAETIKQFQLANGLEADGQCGLMTWIKILNV